LNVYICFRPHPFPEESAEQREEDLARREATLAAVTAIERTQKKLAHKTEDADVHTHAATRVIRRLKSDGTGASIRAAGA
jgi:hypothetical protein